MNNSNILLRGIILCKTRINMIRLLSTDEKIQEQCQDLLAILSRAVDEYKEAEKQPKDDFFVENVQEDIEDITPF